MNIEDTANCQTVSVNIDFNEYILKDVMKTGSSYMSRSMEWSPKTHDLVSFVHYSHGKTRLKQLLQKLVVNKELDR